MTIVEALCLVHAGWSNATDRQQWECADEVVKEEAAMVRAAYAKCCADIFADGLTDKAIAEEREACARMLESTPLCGSEWRKAARAIRARGNAQ